MTSVDTEVRGTRTLDPKHAKRLKRAIRMAHNVSASHQKSKRGLGARRYR